MDKMDPRVLAILSAHNGQLVLRFTNGEVRRFDVRPFMLRGPALAPLVDPTLFAAARVVSGAVEWPGEIDLCYHTLYPDSVPVPPAN